MILTMKLSYATHWTSKGTLSFQGTILLDHPVQISIQLPPVECDHQIQNEELDILFMDGEEGNEGNGDGPSAAQIAVKRILLDNELVVRCARDFLPVNKRLVWV